MVALKKSNFLISINSTKVFVLVILIFNSSIIACSKVCREKYIDENIASADIILAGTVRKLDRNYSMNLYGALIEINRIIKGRQIVYDLFDLNFNSSHDDTETTSLLVRHKSGHNKNTKKKRLVTVTGNTIAAYNFGTQEICESNVKPHDVRIFLLKIDAGKQLHLSSSIIQPISKELRNLNSLFENQFTDRCN